jgi:hypothetical protein
MNHHAIDPRGLFVLYRDGPGIGPLVAFQDCYSGGAYRCFARPQAIGSVVKIKMYCTDAERRNTGEDCSMLHMRILKAVETRSLQAQINRSSARKVSLHPGHWYEVHSD